MQTIIVILIIAAAVGACVYRLVKIVKSKGCDCGCGCGKNCKSKRRRDN